VLFGGRHKTGACVVWWETQDSLCFLVGDTRQGLVLFGGRHNTGQFVCGWMELTQCGWMERAQWCCVVVVVGCSWEVDKILYDVTRCVAAIAYRRFRIVVLDDWMWPQTPGHTCVVITARYELTPQQLCTSICSILHPMVAVAKQGSWPKRHKTKRTLHKFAHQQVLKYLRPYRH